MYRLIAISCSPGPISIMSSMSHTSVTSYRKKGDCCACKLNCGIGLECSYTSEVDSEVVTIDKQHLMIITNKGPKKKAFGRPISVCQVPRGVLIFSYSITITGAIITGINT